MRRPDQMAGPAATSNLASGEIIWWYLSEGKKKTSCSRPRNRNNSRFLGSFGHFDFLVPTYVSVIPGFSSLSACNAVGIMKSLIRRQLLLNKDAKPGAFVLEEKLDAANHLVWVIRISHSSFWTTFVFYMPNSCFLLQTARHSYVLRVCNCILRLHERNLASFRWEVA